MSVSYLSKRGCEPGAFATRSSLWAVGPWDVVCVGPWTCATRLSKPLSCCSTEFLVCSLTTSGHAALVHYRDCFGGLIFKTTYEVMDSAYEVEHSLGGRGTVPGIEAWFFLNRDVLLRMYVVSFMIRKKHIYDYFPCRIHLLMHIGWDVFVTFIFAFLELFFISN